MLAAVLALAVLAVSPATPVSATNEQFVFNVVENEGNDSSAGTLNIAGSDFRFVNTTGHCQDYFNIQSVDSTVIFTTKVNIDREQIFNDLSSDNITCTVKYKENDCDSCLGSIFVTFHIVDVNDVAPTLSNLDAPVQELETFQNIPVNQIIRYLQPRDDDIGINAVVSMHLSSGNDEGYFRIEQSLIEDPSSPNRVLFLNKSLLDVDPGFSFNLTIFLEDMGSPPLNSTQYIVIKVKGVGGPNPPEFPVSEFLFQVVENHPIGVNYPFGQVNVSDDLSLGIYYQFRNDSVDEEVTAQTFGINPFNGMLYLIQSLDFDLDPRFRTYVLFVEARDPGSASGAYADVCIEVLDTNDEYPELVGIDPDNPYIFFVTENQNQSLLSIHFDDKDDSQNDSSVGDVNVSFSYPVMYNISVVAITFLKIIAVTLDEPLDRETSPIINMTVDVSDSGHPALHSSTLFTIYVGDENDNAPQFSMSEFTGSVPESTVSGRLVTKVTASDPDEGEGSTFDFAIAAVHPVEANGWFSINQTTGEIFVASLKSYKRLSQPVKLNVTATDHGEVALSNSTTVTISFTPPYSFAPRSFQQYIGYDIFAADTIYLEFRTGKTDGLLFYEVSPDGIDFTALELINMKLHYTQRQGSVTSIAENTDLALDTWYSVLINITDKQSPEVSVWNRGSEEGSSFAVLQSASSSSCPESEMPGGPTLYIGGLEDAFASPADSLTAHDFSGCIATVVVDSIQLDMECPHSSRNVAPGCLFDPFCPSSCTSECVKYGESTGCQCAGGFADSSCSSTSDYDDFSVENGGFVQFTLGYDFFYESVYNNAGDKNTTENDEVTQTVSISIQPAVDDPEGVIFYSRTTYSQQLLEFLGNTFRYAMYVDGSNQEPELKLRYIYEELLLSKGVQYTIMLDIMNDVPPRLTLSSDGKSRSLDIGYEFPSDNHNYDYIYHQFASQPQTVISLGGKNNEVASRDKLFAGCLSHFTIDGIEIPVRGLLETNLAMESTVDGTDGHVSTFCHDCITGKNDCPRNSTCDMDDLTSSSYTCTCLDGFTDRNGECVRADSPTTARPLATATPTIGGVEPSSSKLQLEIIIGVAVVIIIISFIILISFGLACRWAYIRGKKARLSMNTQVTCHTAKDSSTEAKDIDGSPVGLRMAKNSGRQNAYVLTTLRSSPSVQDDTDNESTTDLHFSPCSLKRKTASNETGFQSASEMEDGRRSFPVVSDSGNEPYSSNSETESDYFTNTSEIVHARSPSNMHLVSSGSVMGVPNTSRIKYPLTSQECKTLQVFRPDSAMLSDTDTDISTTTNNAGQTFSDNETNVSDAVAPKWYKSSSPSTIVDAEPSLPYGIQAAALHKHSRPPKRRPPNLKHFKIASPPHTHRSPSYTYYNDHHPPPLSSSPLVHSNRFDFPPAGPASAGLPRGQHFPVFEHHRLPVISESTFPGHYSRADPYQQHSSLQHQQYSDSVLYPGEHHREVLPPQPVLRGRPEVAGTPPYYAGYQGSSLSPGGELSTPRYRDLNSFPKVNPITYYEQQERMKPIVDQDDSLNFLSEPYIQFEDVSTEPSVIESSVVESTMVDDEKDLRMKNPHLHLPARERLNGYIPSPLTKDCRMASTLPHAPLPKFGHSPTPTEPRIFSPASFNQFSSQGAEEAAADGFDSTLDSIDESPHEIPELSCTSSLLNSPNKSLNHFPSADCTPPINSLSGDTLTGSNHEPSPHANGYHLPVTKSVK